MRKLKVFLCFCIAWVCGSSLCQAQTVDSQTDSLLVPRYLIGGHYYKKGVDLKLLPMESVKGMGGLKADGFSVTKFEVGEDFKSPEEWKAFEIPRQRVKSLAELEENDKTYSRVVEITSSHVPCTPRDSVLADFSLKDLEGKVWNKQAFLGHIVVVNMWYSGCGPCLREMPELSGWKNKYSDVLFFSANFEKADKVRRITTQRGFTWTHLVEDNYFIKWVNTAGYPVTIVIDPKGNVRAIVDGSDSAKHKEVLDTVEKLLKEK